MAQLHNLTPGQVLLLAIQLVTESDLDRLQVLAAERKDVLDQVTIYRLLLTFLPFDHESQLMLATFLSNVLQNFGNISSLDVETDISSVANISESEIEHRIKVLRFNRTDRPDSQEKGDILSNFLIQWTYQAEATTGLSSIQIQLIDEFSDGRDDLHHWLNTYLIPLCRLQNDFYLGQADGLSLKTLEELQGETGIKTLLQFAEAAGEKAEIGRDLMEVVTPWVQGSISNKRRRVSSDSKDQNPTEWNDVYNWIYTTSETNFGLAAKAILQWSGPPTPEDAMNGKQDDQSDCYLRYAQAILAVILNSPLRESFTSFRLEDLLQKAVEVTLLDQRPLVDTGLLEHVSRAHLMHNQLLNAQNPVTYPSDQTFQFISNCIASQEILESFSIPFSIANIAELALFGSEERQKQEFTRVLSQLPNLARSGFDWHKFRTQMQQLHSSDHANAPLHKPLSTFGRLSLEYIDTQTLIATLAAGNYSFVSDVYLDSSRSPLEQSSVRDIIISAIYLAYDNASNGNRTRGGMKKASDLLKTFEPHFPNDDTLNKIEHLLKATHSLSFYQLTLQHGVPFQPVNIRIRHDPLSLIEKALEQNTKAYTKLDDLLDIGRNLVKAGLIAEQSSEALNVTIDEQLFDATHRITYLAITSALADNDFDTAYSYIMTRLSTSPFKASSEPFTDDTSWRAAYAAGKYRPLHPATSVHESIGSLSKRMDLLSLALTIAPNAEPLSEILAAWRRSEEEMDSLRSQALNEERSLESRTNLGTTSTLPGGFGPEDRDLDAAETKRLHERRTNAGFSPTYEEEAPMGLFDVAKGAASAFRNSAFPLERAAQHDDPIVARNHGSANENRQIADHENDGGMFSTDEQKTRRKRDVVSGIVTGGLVSGMSWVLGAQPANNREGEERDQR